MRTLPYGPWHTMLQLAHYSQASGCDPETWSWICLGLVVRILQCKHRFVALAKPTNLVIVPFHATFARGR